MGAAFLCVHTQHTHTHIYTDRHTQTPHTRSTHTLLAYTNTQDVETNPRLASYEKLRSILTLIAENAVSAFLCFSLP